MTWRLMGLRKNSGEKLGILQQCTNWLQIRSFIASLIYLNFPGELVLIEDIHIDKTLQTKYNSWSVQKFLSCKRRRSMEQFDQRGFHIQKRTRVSVSCFPYTKMNFLVTIVGLVIPFTTICQANLKRKETETRKKNAAQYLNLILKRRPTEHPRIDFLKS